MPHPAVSVARDRAAVVRPAVTGPRTAEPSVPRPQWAGLFLEPEWPPCTEEDDG